MTLRGWIDEESPISTKHCDTNKYMIRYPEEVKKEAVLELCERRKSAEVIAKSHGVPRTTLCQWKNRKRQFNGAFKNDALVSTM